MTDLFGPDVYHTAHLYMNADFKDTVVQPVTNLGVSMLNTFIASIVSLFVGFGLGWYVKGRGVTGVKTDIGNAEKTIVADAQAL